MRYKWQSNNSSFTSKLNKFCSVIKTMPYFSSLFSSSTDILCTMRRMKKVLCLSYTHVLCICSKPHQNVQGRVPREFVSKRNAFSYFTRIIHAISCIDFVWYYASFLKKKQNKKSIKKKFIADPADQVLVVFHTLLSAA